MHLALNGIKFMPIKCSKCLVIKERIKWKTDSMITKWEIWAKNIVNFKPKTLEKPNRKKWTYTKWIEKKFNWVNCVGQY